MEALRKRNEMGLFVHTDEEHIEAAGHAALCQGYMAARDAVKKLAADLNKIAKKRKA